MLEIFPNDAQNISKQQDKNINPKILIRRIITSNKNKFRDKFRIILSSYRITQCKRFS